MLASVIVPAYNSEKTIGECIESLKKQEYKEKFEIIVVDDGSKDSTAAIAKKMGAKVFVQENSGPAKARNLGAKNARGEILLFTDSDCIAEKKWLMEMLSPFNDKNVVGVQGAYKTRQTSVVARFVQLEVEERYEHMKRKAAELDWIGSYAAAYRKKDFFETGGFDESFPEASGEDPELSYRLAKSGKKLVFNPNAIVYHTHPETLEKYFWVKFQRAFYRVALYSKHKDKVISDSYTPPELKFQIAAQYASWALLAAGTLALAIGNTAMSMFLGGVSLLAFLAIPASATKFFLFAAKKDPQAGMVGVVFMIPSRTAAFCLGLVAGLVKKVVK